MNLEYWNSNKNFSLYYNSNHVISLESDIKPPVSYLPLEDFGFSYFCCGANSGILSEQDQSLLNCYIKAKEMEKEHKKDRFNMKFFRSYLDLGIGNHKILLYYNGEISQNFVKDTNMVVDPGFRHIVEFDFDDVCNKISEYASNDDIRKLKIYYNIHKPRFSKEDFIKKYKGTYPNLELKNPAHNWSTWADLEKDMIKDLDFLIQNGR